MADTLVFIVLDDDLRLGSFIWNIASFEINLYLPKIQSKDAIGHPKNLVMRAIVVLHNNSTMGSVCLIWHIVSFQTNIYLPEGQPKYTIGHPS